MTGAHPPPTESGSRGYTLVAALLLAALSVGCATAGRPLTPGEPLLLRPGEQVALPNAAALRYLGVSADSRCRPDVQCIHAGDADVKLEYTVPNAAPRAITINTDAPMAQLGRWRVRLLSLDFAPLPNATLRLDDTH